MPHLKVLKGRDAGAVLALGDEFYIGRDAGNDLRVADETASRHHARLQRVDRAYVLVDLGSNNGTFVNGERAAERVLAEGDHILVGKTLVVFEASTETAPAAVTVREARTEARVERAVPAPPERRLRALYGIWEALNATLDRRAVAEALAGGLLEALGAEAVVVEAGDETVVRTRSGQEAVVNRGAMDRARGAREAVLLVDERGVSIACAPILRGGECLGVAYAESRQFDEEDLRFVNAAAHAAALALSNARKLDDRERVVAALRREVTIVGNDSNFRRVLDLVDRAAPTDSTVLILGESGTGKELVARRLHDGSGRTGPFVPINCAALAETLLESELFGHEKGAFTGADRARPGKFEAADGGTILLDEIGDVSPAFQAKLLRVLQEKTFFRVGGTKPVTSDVRIVAATNRDLRALVREGRFREDLFYRLGVVTVTLPPIRERRSDIPLLVYHALERVRGRRRIAVSEKAMERLTSYAWPGNVRELENILERAVLLTDGEVLEAENLPLDTRESPAGDWPIRIVEAEKLCVQRALESTGGKKGQAARLLGISWPTLNKKLKDYGLE